MMLNTTAPYSLQPVYREEEPEISLALSLYRKALLHSKIDRAAAFLKRSAHQLMDLDEILRQKSLVGEYDGGIQAVAIDQIHGSLGRTGDFDGDFHPLSEKTRDRWVSVAKALLQGKPLPAVELVQVGETYFVVDGHHRISAARALGQQAIDAQVRVYQVV